MSTHKMGLRRLALVLALAPLAVAAIAAPAQAYDRGHDHRDRHWHGRPGGYGGGYYAPPPPVYYPDRPASPGISLFFPIR